MLGQRVATALALLAVLGLGLTVAAPWGFPALAIGFVTVGVAEWLQLLKLSRRRAWLVALLAGVALLGLALDRTLAPPWVAGLLGVSALTWLALVLGLLANRAFPLVTLWRAFYLVAGVVLPTMAGLALLLAYRVGLLYMVSILALVWVADIAAYFCGRALGRHKLAPRISPGKTIEGAIGGVVAVLVLGYAASRLPLLDDSFFHELGLRVPILAFFAILTLLSLLSIVGDLLESHLKRQAGVKDSGSLLPGHGGVLDRIDALLPVVPIAYLFGRYL